jgi:hypothetical protein
MWEARADRMLFPGICHSLRGDFSWPKMGILRWPLTTALFAVVESILMWRLPVWVLLLCFLGY